MFCDVILITDGHFKEQVNSSAKTHTVAPKLQTHVDLFLCLTCVWHVYTANTCPTCKHDKGELCL